MEIIILTFKRLLSALPSLFGVLLITFILTHALPGDPAAYLAGPAATNEAIAEIRKELGLDKNILEQFILYVKNIAHEISAVPGRRGDPSSKNCLTVYPPPSK